MDYIVVGATLITQSKKKEHSHSHVVWCVLCVVVSSTCKIERTWGTRKSRRSHQQKVLRARAKPTRSSATIFVPTEIEKPSPVEVSLAWVSVVCLLL